MPKAKRLTNKQLRKERRREKSEASRIATGRREGEPLLNLVTDVAKSTVKQHVEDVTGATHVTRTANLLQLGAKRVDDVADKHKEHAWAAGQAYVAPKDRAGDGYLSEWSNEEMAVWHDEVEDLLTVAFRGTVNMDDVKTDAALVAGALGSTNRWQRNRKVLSQLADEFNESEFRFTGHSLGGALAQHAEAEFGSGDAVVFNPGASPLDSTLRKSDATIYSIGGDAVSAFANVNTPSNVRLISSNMNFLDAHFMERFQ